MFSLSFLVFLLALSVAPHVGASRGTVRAVLASQYSRTHSLGPSYKFDARDGWHTINATNLLYQPRRLYDSAYDMDHANTKNSTLEGRKSKVSTSPKTSSKKVLGAVGKAINFIGEVISVVITWYTGNDLRNPSCWPNSGWTPTDQSFVCAVTQDGWTTRPKCFDFLELCTSQKACITVRVVDTCAGCKSGSKHVDLTRAAFAKLASLNVGILSVNMRLTSTPTEWSEDLWGPKT